MRRNHRGPRPEGFEVVQALARKYLRQREREREREREIEPFTLDLRDKIHQLDNEFSLY